MLTSGWENSFAITSSINRKSADEKEVMSPTQSNWDRYQKNSTPNK
jgi:hypothetical protein